jgi:hypothetical protein
MKQLQVNIYYSNLLGRNINIEGKIEKLWSRWLRHCATSRKIAALNPDEVTGIFC